MPHLPMQEGIVVLGQVAHLAKYACSNEPLFTEVMGVSLGFKLSLNGFKAVMGVINLGVEGTVAVDLCNEVPLIQIVDSCAEDGVMGLRTPKHVSEPGRQGLKRFISEASGIRESVKVNSVGEICSALGKAPGLSIR
jgi:hypothetical protein